MLNAHMKTLLDDPVPDLLVHHNADGALGDVPDNSSAAVVELVGHTLVNLKRQPAGPRDGFVLDSSTLETVTPIPYDVVNDLKGGY